MEDILSLGQGIVRQDTSHKIEFYQIESLLRPKTILGRPVDESAGLWLVDKHKTVVQLSPLSCTWERDKADITPVLSFFFLVSSQFRVYSQVTISIKLQPISTSLNLSTITMLFKPVLLLAAFAALAAALPTGGTYL